MLRTAQVASRPETLTMKLVLVPRLHPSPLRLVKDPYKDEIGPGWTCDCCGVVGKGLVYHSVLGDYDFSRTCVDRERKLGFFKVLKERDLELYLNEAKAERSPETKSNQKSENKPSEAVDIEDNEETNRAASMLQAQQRGKQARRKTAKMKEEKEENDAATKVQSSFRGKQARKRASEIKEQREAEATSAGKSDKGDKPSEAVDIEDNEETNRAASMLQAQQRGKQARRKTAKMKEEKEENDAATKVQSSFRGKQARKRASEIKEQREAEATSAGKSDKDNEGQTRAAESVERDPKETTASQPPNEKTLATANETVNNGSTEEKDNDTVADAVSEVRPETEKEEETNPTITGMENIGGVDEVEMLVAVHSMFIRYDADDSGAIDADELRQVYVFLHSPLVEVICQTYDFNNLQMS